MQQSGDAVRQNQKQLLTLSPRVGATVSVPATRATDGAMMVEESIWREDMQRGFIGEPSCDLEAASSDSGVLLGSAPASQPAPGGDG